MATRIQFRYPGLAEARMNNGKKGYFFTNKIQLDPRRLAEPLADRVPKRYFVNSMSDLFHAKVPADFIAAVFEVMEKATWHQFQVHSRPTGIA